MFALIPDSLNIWSYFVGRMTLEKNLKFIGFLWGLNEQVLEERIEVSLKTLGIYDKRNEWFQRLSRGMMQRAVISLILILRPQIIILDEPLIHIDAEGFNIFKECVLNELDKSTFIISSHNKNFLREISTRIVYLNKEIKYIEYLR